MHTLWRHQHDLLFEQKMTFQFQISSKQFCTVQLITTKVILDYTLRIYIVERHKCRSTGRGEMWRNYTVLWSIFVCLLQMRVVRSSNVYKLTGFNDLIKFYDARRIPRGLLVLAGLTYCSGKKNARTVIIFRILWRLEFVLESF